MPKLMTPTSDYETLQMAKKISSININDGWLIYRLSARADLTQHQSKLAAGDKPRRFAGWPVERWTHVACIRRASEPVEFPDVLSGRSRAPVCRCVQEQVGRADWETRRVNNNSHYDSKMGESKTRGSLVLDLMLNC